MSNTPPSPPITSGTEDPSKFLMGVEPGETEEAKFEQAVDEFFGNNRPQAPGEETSEEEGEEGEEQGTETSEEGSEEEGEETQQVTGQGEQQGQGGEEGGEAEGDLAADFVTLFRARYGREPNQAEVEGLFSLAEWANSLTPQQQADIQAAYLGQGNQSQTQTPPTPEPDPLDEEYADDPTLGPLYKRLQEMQANMERLAQGNAESYQQQVLRGLETGANSFKEKYGVSDNELAALQGAVGSLGILPAFVQAHNSPEAGITAALDYVYWQTPEFRNREIQRQIEAQAEAEKQHAQRKRKASSVTGTGGNGASRTEAPKKSTNPWDNVAAEIRDAQTNGQGS